MKKVIINSLPKSGTNLLAKALKLMGYWERGGIGSFLVAKTTLKGCVRNLLWNSFGSGETYIVGVDSPINLPVAPVNRILDRVGESGFLSAHLGYSEKLLEAAKSRGFTPILVTRDPRAVLASFVAFVLDHKTHLLHHDFAGMDEVERYRAALLGREFAHGRKLLPLKERCLALAPWIEDADVMHLRFEDLVGSQGGGDDAVQKRLLEALCRRLDVPQERVATVAGELFGPGRKTFRKGQVDSWKEEIPPEVQDRMDAELDEVLRSWGYRE
jgi:hypothetical protein